MSVIDRADADADRDEQQRITCEVAAIVERREVIQQAVGMLMVIYALDADQAFGLLKSMSQSENIKLRTVAAHLVSDLPRSNFLTEELRSVCDEVILAQRQTRRAAAVHSTSTATESGYRAAE